jgi:hypothetical protein
VTARPEAYAGALRVADVRLLAPAPNRRVALLGAPELADPLRAAGHELVESAPDLVIAGRGRGRAAASLKAPTVILLGGRAGALRGYRKRTIVIRRGATAPRLYVPVDSAPAVAHALLAPAQGRGPLKRLAARLAIALTRAGLPVVDHVTLATRGDHQPALLTAAKLDLGANWYLLTGDGDDLQRGVWFCFDPDWVVKFSRVRGNAAPFDREARGLELLARAAPELAARAPRIAARFDVDGLPAAVESVGRGERLQDLLEDGRAPVRLVGSIADWVAALGAATRTDASGAELQRLEHEVLPAWGVGADFVRRLSGVPAVLQHNDLGTWNVVADGTDFTVLDWESSRESGLPLWDLAYFLTDALLERRGPEPASVKTGAALRLLRGDAPGSDELFARLRSAAAGLGIAPDAVGPLVTLGWLHHGLSARARAERGGAPVGTASVGVLERLAQPWLDDPELGPAWPAFVRRA